jgi:hypothetical protein
MDFEDVSCVVPWIETAVTLDMDLEAPQRAEPRGFKSHLAFHRMPPGARYIVALRDPKDALLSVYRFFDGWLLEPGALSLEQFAPCRIDVPPDRGYFGHLVSWWEQRHRADVLLLSYERMVAAPEETIRRVAAFSGIALDNDLLALALEHSSLPFMLRHQAKFSEGPMQRAAERRCGLPHGVGGAKVRRGTVGAHRDELPAEVAQAVDRRWRELVTPRFGFPDYAALERALHA